MPTLLPSRRGYTRRRPGEAGPALVTGKRRKFLSSGSVENGLPPARRGKRDGFGPATCFRCPKERAGRACAAHMGVDEDGVAGFFSPTHPRETGGQTSSPETFAERPESRAEPAERGAERCHIKLLYEAAFSAPSIEIIRPPRANKVRPVDRQGRNPSFIMPMPTR